MFDWALKTNYLSYLSILPHSPSFLRPRYPGTPTLGAGGFCGSERSVSVSQSMIDKQLRYLCVVRLILSLPDLPAPPPPAAPNPPFPHRSQTNLPARAAQLSCHRHVSQTKPKKSEHCSHTRRSNRSDCMPCAMGRRL